MRGSLEDGYDHTFNNWGGMGHSRGDWSPLRHPRSHGGTTIGGIITTQSGTSDVERSVKTRYGRVVETVISTFNRIKMSR